MNYDSESEKKEYEQLDQILERAKKSGSITFNEVDDAFADLDITQAEKDAFYDKLEESGIEVAPLIIPDERYSQQIAASIAPDAPRQCPVIGFVDSTLRSLKFFASAKMRVTARISIASFACVPVP